MLFWFYVLGLLSATVISWRWMKTLQYDLTLPDSLHFKFMDDMQVQLGAYHRMPESLQQACQEVLLAFPELQNVYIDFAMGKTQGPTMQAMPPYNFLFVPKSQRRYTILISDNTQIEKGIRLVDLSNNVLKGWLGHELGHILDYHRRNRWQLALFVIGYLMSPKYRRDAEKVADLYAIQRKMADCLVQKKEYILNHQKISNAYKARIKRYYMTPREVIQIISKDKGALEFTPTAHSLANRDQVA